MKHGHNDNKLEVPTPGSPEAIKQGCVCPRIDNSHGLGMYKDDEGNPVFVIREDCVLHAKQGGCK